MNKQLIVTLNSATQSVNIATSDKFLASELKAIAQIIRNNTANISMQSYKNKKEKIVEIDQNTQNILKI